jgi:hypothetical protein
VDLNLGHWELSWRISLISSFRKLMGALIGRSPLADAADNAAFDLTLHGSQVILARPWHTVLTELLHDNE